MAVSLAMRRLLRVLLVQEDQYRAALDGALAELRRLQGALEATEEQERRGRQLVWSSAATGRWPIEWRDWKNPMGRNGAPRCWRQGLQESKVDVSDRRRDFLSEASRTGAKRRP